MERHQVTAAFPTPCNSLCVRTWELRHGDDKVNKWSIPSKRRWWKRAQKTVQWKQYQYNDIQGDWWNGTQHQRHEKEPKRSRNIQWCFKKDSVMLHQLRPVMGCAVCDPEWKNAQIQHIMARKETLLYFCHISNNLKIRLRQYVCLKLYSPSGLFWVFHGNTVVHFWQMTADHQ